MIHSDPLSIGKYSNLFIVGFVWTAETADSYVHGAVDQMHIEKGHAIGQHEEETQKVQQNKNKESQEGEQKAIMFEKFHSENPLLLNVCRTLFPDNHKYVWSGPRALVQREGSRRRSCIDAAIEILMK
ncbi:hypothetical protein GH714_021610 [Hevea brasiliensis]|uniref:Uncharacterized protein n=1 Tax=Hevea brasiliensis TaxID=3981 RepID=A0A6A6N1L8_HEVBR|nr:hypothetical protein GH714_021610 [Hevea brasiliensis]